MAVHDTIKRTWTEQLGSMPLSVDAHASLYHRLHLGSSLVQIKDPLQAQVFRSSTSLNNPIIHLSISQQPTITNIMAKRKKGTTQSVGGGKRKKADKEVSVMSYYSQLTS